MRNVSTRQLQAFVDLADLRNFTRAASRTHLSQPAFSALIRALEDALGARLFDRTTRSVELTVEGNAFIHAARRLLHDADQAFADLRDHAARRRGRVSIALLPSLAAGWMPPILARYNAEYPDIELEVADVLSDACIQRVQSGQADFAIASTRADSAELSAEKFCDDDFHVVCRRDHALAARRKVGLDDLGPHPIVQLARSSSVRQYLEAAIYPTQLRTVMELDQLSTVAGMVRAGLGISVVPTLTLFHFDGPELVTRPLDAPGLRRQIFVVRRRDRTLSSAAQGLYEALCATRPKSPRARAKR
jgi:LysR family carnitine catabolism transcriptional activator